MLLCVLLLLPMLLHGCMMMVLEISEVSSNTIYLGCILPRGIIRIHSTHITHTAMGGKVYGRGYKSIKVFSIKVLCKNS